MWTSFIGFMASGKSTVARTVQSATNRPSVSLDHLVEEKAGRPVAAIFDGQGESAFRELEAAALTALDPERPLLVDTGGGLVETPAAVAQLRACGVVIWLDMSWTVARARLEDSDESLRPMVGLLGWAGLEDLFRKRRRLYAAAADFRLRTDRASAAEIAQRAMLRSLQWERRREEVRR